MGIHHNVKFDNICNDFLNNYDEFFVKKYKHIIYKNFKIIIFQFLYNLNIISNK